MPGEGARLAGEQELAFKHVLIRDVAYAMLPKAVRARKHAEVGAFIEQRAGERGDEVVALLAEHYGRAATLGEEVHLDAEELAPLRAKALRVPRGRRRRGRRALLQPARRSPTTKPPPALGVADDAEAGAASREKQGDLALRLGRVDAAIERVGAGASSYHRERETISSTSPSCTARSAPRSRTRASASRRSSTTSRAST